MNNLIPRSTRHFFINDPTDILFRDLYNSDSFFDKFFALTNNAEKCQKINYPVNIRDTKEGLEIELAIVGVDKKDVKIEVKDDILSIVYLKEDNNDANVEYIHRGITQRSFNLAWKISNKVDLSKINASMDKGLLKILVPARPEKNPTFVDIK
jgi:HSP20 family protein